MTTAADALVDIGKSLELLREELGHRMARTQAGTDEGETLARLRRVVYDVGHQIEDAYGLSRREAEERRRERELLQAREETFLTALRQNVATARKDKATYQEKLESAKGPDIFKYIILINGASLELYVNQSREQAASSFVLSKRVAVGGFVLLS